MPFVDTDICNLALSHIGVADEIASLTEDSPEAQALNRFYTMAIDDTLRAFPYPFARKVVSLALISENGDDDHPDTNYLYSYVYPSDCLMARRIQSGIRTDYRSSRVSYDIMARDQGSIILTDMEDAILDYTSTDGRNPARWQADLGLAVSFKLAWYAAPRLTKGDPFKLRQQIYALWLQQNRRAQASALNEVQPDQDPDSELILSRY